MDNSNWSEKHKFLSVIICRLIEWQNTFVTTAWNIGYICEEWELPQAIELHIWEPWNFLEVICELIDLVSQSTTISLLDAIIIR